jgi:hypothetical protein
VTASRSAATVQKGKKPMSKARARLQSSPLVHDGAGLCTVECLIIFVLFAAIAMGTWQTFGKTDSSVPSDTSNKLDTDLTSAESSQTGTKP